MQVSASGNGAYEVSLSPFRNGLAVAWYDTRDGNAEIYLRMTDADGHPSGQEIRLTDDPAQSYEVSIANTSDGLAVAWYDKDTTGFLQAHLGLWSPERGFRRLAALSATGGASRNPIIKALDDRLFAAWIETTNGSSKEAVFAEWWNTGTGEPDGRPVELAPVGSTTWNLNAAVTEDGIAYVVFDAKVGTQAEELYAARWQDERIERRRLTRDDGARSKYPDIALDGNRAAITWFDERDYNREIYLFAGLLDATTAAPLGALAGLDRTGRRVTSTPGESIGAYLAWNRGRIGLAWSEEIDGQHEIYQQTFDAAAGPTTPPARLTVTATRSLIPAIAAWRNGFALAWNEVNPGPAGMHDPATTAEVSVLVIP